MEVVGAEDEPIAREVGDEIGGELGHDGGRDPAARGVAEQRERQLCRAGGARAPVERRVAVEGAMQ